jgi:LacI family transcriptional regulator
LTVNHTDNPKTDFKPFARRIGVRHIANTLGVSIATVDRALHDRPDINLMTKARVVKLAQQLGYRPNLAARFLRSHVPLRIAAAIPLEIAWFFDELRRGIDSAATHFAALGLKVEYYNYPRLGVGEVEAVQRALEGNPVGLIVTPGLPGALKPLLRRASRGKIPVVCVNTDAPGSGRLTAITMDPVFSGSTAAELVGRFSEGKGDVALVTGSMKTSVHSRQVKAFQSTLAALYPGMRIAYVLEAHDNEEEAYQKMVATIRRKHTLSAVYVSTANSTGVLRALSDLGVLGRVTVVTTDLFPLLARYIHSGAVAATVWQRPRSQGRMAVEALFHFLAEGRCPRHTMELTPHIVLRSNLKRLMETLEFSDSTWFRATPSELETERL